MIEKIKHIITILDLPSGVILGVHTLVMIALSIAAFCLKRPIESTIIAVYSVVLGAFAIHKTTTATTSIVQQSQQGTPDDTPKP